MSTQSALKRKFEIPQFEPISKTSLRLFNTSDSIVFGIVHPKTGLFSVRHESRLYVGQYDFNLGFYDDSGTCTDEHILGFSIASLTALFADQTKKPAMKTAPREEWKAHFNFKPTKETRTIRVRLTFFSPFEDHSSHSSFQAEMDLHEITVE